MTPTARALAWCRKQGWQAAVVEKWIAQTRQRKDVWGFGDLLVVGEASFLGAMLVQVTSDSGASARRHKIVEACNEAAQRWIRAGNRIEVWAWGKHGSRGKRKLWRLRRDPILMADLLITTVRGPLIDLGGPAVETDS